MKSVAYRRVESVDIAAVRPMARLDRSVPALTAQEQIWVTSEIDCRNIPTNGRRG